ncbi:MAG: AIR synthase-related protein, partial [Gammaproteobacteria bacterium]
TFNCGIGMTVIVSAAQADAALALLAAQGERASLIGEVRAGVGDVLIQ